MRPPRTKCRRRALEELPELDCARDDALLVATELVTNAVRHSHCAEDELLTVSASCRHDLLCISVVDPGLSGRHAELVDRPADTGGLGLRLVQALSERWGAERQGDSYRVWAELPLAA